MALFQWGSLCFLLMSNCCCPSTSSRNMEQRRKGVDTTLDLAMLSWHTCTAWWKRLARLTGRQTHAIFSLDKADVFCLQNLFDRNTKEHTQRFWLSEFDNNNVFADIICSLGPFSFLIVAMMLHDVTTTWLVDGKRTFWMTAVQCVFDGNNEPHNHLLTVVDMMAIKLKWAHNTSQSPHLQSQSTIMFVFWHCHMVWQSSLCLKQWTSVAIVLVDVAPTAIFSAGRWSLFFVLFGVFVFFCIHISGIFLWACTMMQHVCNHLANAPVIWLVCILSLWWKSNWCNHFEGNSIALLLPLSKESSLWSSKLSSSSFWQTESNTGGQQVNAQQASKCNGTTTTMQRINHLEFHNNNNNNNNNSSIEHPIHFVATCMWTTFANHSVMCWLAKFWGANARFLLATMTQMFACLPKSCQMWQTMLHQIHIHPKNITCKPNKRQQQQHDKDNNIKIINMKSHQQQPLVKTKIMSNLHKLDMLMMTMTKHPRKRRTRRNPRRKRQCRWWNWQCWWC